MGPWTQPSQLLYRFGEFEVDLWTGELRKKGIKLRVQVQPLKVLAMLLARPGELVTREHLREGLWHDNTFVDFDSGLNTAVNRLRTALNDSAETPRFVETVGRRGYRFIAPVTSDCGKIEIPADSADSTVDERPPDSGQKTSSGPSGLEQPFTPPELRTNAGGRNRALAVLSAILIVAGVGGYATYRWRSEPARVSSFEGLRFTKLTGTGEAEDVAISPDGAYLVYSQRDRNGVGLWLYQIARGGKTQILPSEDIDFRGLTFSPDGNSLYFVRSRAEVGSYKDLYAMPVLGGHARLLAEDVDSPVSFSPNGHQFAYSQGIGPPYATRIRIANADGTGNRVLATITSVNSNIETGPAWSPDGRTLVVSQMLRGDRSGYVLDAVSVSDGRIWEVCSHPAVIGRPIWLPDSQTILAALDDSTGAGQLWTISLRRGKERRVTNDLANWGSRIDATRDARTVSDIQWSVVANLWSAPATNLSKIRQLSNGEMAIVAAVAKPDGKILAVSGNNDLWIMNGDGTGLAPFSSLPEVASPGTCGDFVVAASYSSAEQHPQAGPGQVKVTKLGSGRIIVQHSYQSGPVDIMRVDKNGRNPTKLASGFLYSPACSPDGKFVYYVLMGEQQRIFRVPIEGGSSEIVGDVPGQSIRGTMRISPNGRLLAFPYDQDGPKVVTQLAVISTNGGQLVRTFDAPGGIYRESCLRWSPDGKALQYLLTKGDVTNLWEQPFTKASAEQITRFDSGRIFDFNWTADGKQLLLARGEVAGDVVLVSNLH